MSDLKPCPFCGGKGELDFANCNHTYLDNDGYLCATPILYTVACNFCGCTIGNYEGTDRAIEAWNRRIPYIPEIEGFDPRHLTDEDKKDITDALNFLMDKIKEEL